MFTFKLLAASAAAASLLVAASAHADESQCENNAKHSGNFLSGNHYKTYEEYTAVKPSEVYKKILMGLMSEGWSIQAQDKDSGIISALASPGISTNKQAVLNIIIDTTGKVTRVSGELNVPAMLTSFGAVESLCKVYANLDGS